MEIYQSKLDYYTSLNNEAKVVAAKASKLQPVAQDIMLAITEFYKSAKVESYFSGTAFASSYHSPITSELEFFIARILYHFSEMNGLGWQVLLRKQEKKTAPDIRIVSKGKTISVIEIKAKAGWIQPFLSQDRYEKDLKKGRYNPDDLINVLKQQIKKYSDTFNVPMKNIYYLLPTLTHVHRKGYKRVLADYYNYFEKTSGLSKKNLVLLSENMLLNLSVCSTTVDFRPTTDFEEMLKGLKLLQ